MVSRILYYFLLFLVSFLVFDFTTTALGVFIALAALYHFSSKAAARGRL
ncbi:MAG: hypothetical protein HY580_05935 [Nitrospinae bacterium]|nr:hypothetical protein [Nitrospinota bacterium]